MLVVRSCIGKYYTSNLAGTGKLPKAMPLEPIMSHVFVFLDTKCAVTYYVFLKLLKLRNTLIFQVKVRHQGTDGDAVTKAMELDVG